ncbi:MAG: hypothetical protein LC746_00195, partial [Acidobacteria bacterium]|nr:hypothetical protein [Acidobacteriota bacterium]
MRYQQTGKLLTPALALALLATACQPGTNTNTTNASNANAANINASSNANEMTSSPTAFETREPNEYTATLVITQAATNRGQAANVPTVQIARSGDNRRYDVTNLPVIGELVFLDRADKRYIVLPSRKQYLELGPGTTGFDVRSLTPAQMADQLKSRPGVTLVGDDTVNG